MGSVSGREGIGVSRSRVYTQQGTRPRRSGGEWGGESKYVEGNPRQHRKVRRLAASREATSYETEVDEVGGLGERRRRNGLRESGLRLEGALLQQTWRQRGSEYCGGEI